MKPDLSPLDGSLWLCEPARLRMAILRVMSYKTCPTARALVTARRAALSAARDAPRNATAGRRGQPLIGVIEVSGPIGQRVSAEMMKAGGTSSEAVGAALDALMDASEVGCVLLHIDSPGGESYGTAELAEKIYSYRSVKPIYAMVDSLCASAAYWIASACSVIVATPGADVGSVGVYVLHVDQSKALKKDGIKITAVHAGKHKVDGAPFAPLSADAREYMQGQVDECYESFVGAVARNRGTTRANVEAKYGQGRVMSAQKARAAGLVDHVMTYEALFAELYAGRRPGRYGGTGKAGAGMERLRAEHEARKAGRPGRASVAQLRRRHELEKQRSKA